MAMKKYRIEIDELNVLIVRVGPGYYAQGIEIDFAACGDSIEDAQRRFERGFFETVSANLARFRDLKRFIKPAPEDIRREFGERVEEDKYTFSSVSVHTLEEKLGVDSGISEGVLSGLRAFKYFSTEKERPCDAFAA